MSIQENIELFAPTLIFSKGESYFPCGLFFQGRDIQKNKETYDKLKIGDDYDPFTVGKAFGLQVPWLRSIYYLPETKALGRIQELAPVPTAEVMLDYRAHPLEKIKRPLFNIEEIGPVSLPYVSANSRENLN